MLPLLLSRLDSRDVVVYTYAAVALDRILSMRVGDSTVLMCVLCVDPASFFIVSAGFHLQMFNLSLHNS